MNNSPLEETERLAARKEPMSPGEKAATEAARKGLLGRWRETPLGRWLLRNKRNPDTDGEPKDSGS
jgi:hypothetical protein